MSEQTGFPSDDADPPEDDHPPGDAYRGRKPTSHERRASQPWDASYRDSPPPWDIGGPQPAVVRLASEGVFSGMVLDAGCGTGENALHVAATGADVLGIDVAGTAVAIAREHAAARAIDAHFMVADALRLDDLGRVFDTVLDCALFHAFDDGERLQYAAGLTSVTAPGTRLYLLCFSDADPDSSGPHPVSRQALSAPFSALSEWKVVSIRPETLLARFAPEGVPAWLAIIDRVPRPS